MVDNNYFVSERFIHDDLVRKVAQGIHTLYDEWRAHHRIQPFLLTWPSTPVRAEDGTSIDGACRLELADTTKDERWRLIQEAMVVTKAYALLLCEQHDDYVELILESQHGTKHWVLPIQRSGDVSVLRPAEQGANERALGLLWQKTVGSS